MCVLYFTYFLYMMKVVHRRVCKYICVRVSPCAYVFKFAYVFYMVKVVCRLSRRRSYMVQIKYVLMGRPV